MSDWDPTDGWVRSENPTGLVSFYDVVENFGWDVWVDGSISLIASGSSELRGMSRERAHKLACLLREAIEEAGDRLAVPADDPLKKR